MTASLRQWFADRTIREKQLVLVAAGIAVILLAWLLVYRPINLALENAKHRQIDALIARAEVQSLRDAIVAAQTDIRSPPQQPIRDVITSEAVRIGFEVNQIEPLGNDGVRIIIEAARPQVFFAWVGDIETRLGLDIEQLTARPNRDETLAVAVTFREGR